MNLVNDEEHPIDLPENWNWIKLGDICEKPQYGWTTKAIKNGRIKILRTTDITSGKINWNTVPYCQKEPVDIEKYLLHDGDILISRAGSVGYSCLIKKPMESIFASYLIRFRTNINQKYLAYFLKSPLYWKAISEKKLGIAIPNVNATKLSEILVPLAPKQDQEKISSKIKELFTKLEAGAVSLEQTKIQLKRYRQSLLKAAFKGKLTEKWREKNLEKIMIFFEKLQIKIINGNNINEIKNQIRTLKLYNLPHGWIWTQLGEIGELNRGKSAHRPRNDPKLFGGQYPFIQTGDIRKSDGIVINYSQTYSEEGLKQSKVWPKGTLCITIAANIAETAFLGINACFPDSIVGFLNKTDLCNINYVEFYLRYIKKNLEHFAPSTTLKNINLKILKELYIPLPSIYEQNVIVKEIERYYTIADSMNQDLTRSIEATAFLKQCILHSAFTGNLNPQVTSDESDLELLTQLHDGHEKKSQQRRLTDFE